MIRQPAATSPTHPRGLDDGPENADRQNMKSADAPQKPENAAPRPMRSVEAIVEMTVKLTSLPPEAKKIPGGGWLFLVRAGDVKVRVQVGKNSWKKLQQADKT